MTHAVTGITLSTWTTLCFHRIFQLLLLFVVASSALYTRTMLLPLQEALRLAMALSDNQMAVLQGLPIAFGVIVAMPLGVLSDRRSRARLCLGFVLWGLVASLLSAWSSGFFCLFATRILAAVAASAVWTCVLSLVADWFSPVQRGRATMFVSIGAVLGISSAFGLGGALLTVFGSQIDRWRWAMLGLAAPLVVILPLVLLLRDPARMAAEVRDTSKGAYQQLWSIRRRVWPLAAGFALVGGIADGAVIVWSGPMFTRSFGLSADRVGAVMALSLLVSGVSGPVVGGMLADLSQRIGGPHRTAIVLMGLLMLSIPFGCFAFAPNAMVAGAMLGSFLVCGAAFAVALLTLTTILIPNHLHATSLSLFLAITTLSSYAIAPLMVSELSELLGGQGMIGKSMAMVCMTSSALGAVTFWIARRSWSASSPEGSSLSQLPDCAEVRVCK